MSDETEAAEPQPGEHVPTEHLLMRISDALALDERVGELGLEVHEGSPPAGRCIVVSGHVSTDVRKQGVVPVVAGVLAEHDVHAEVVDETVVPAANRPGSGEVL